MKVLAEMSHLGYVLRMYRNEHHLTQQTMASLVGVSIHSYHLWERKGKMPSVKHLMTIADMLGKSLEEVMCMAKCPFLESGIEL